MVRYSELIPILLAAVLGYVGKLAQDQWAARQERRRSQAQQWAHDRQRYLLPLAGAARHLHERLTCLAQTYRGGTCAPGTAASFSRDFRELYALSDEELHGLWNLDAADPNRRRRDPDTVQRVRTRMCRELNYATSSLYLAARYLARAGLVRQLLDDDRSSLPRAAISDVTERLQAVTDALQGATGAGLASEQQDSIGEIMRTADDRVFSQYEFRRRLLEVPGWEQFTALLTFFITENDDPAHPGAARFGAKVDHEVRATVQALRRLEATLRRLTAHDSPRGYTSAPVADGPLPAPW